MQWVEAAEGQQGRWGCLCSAAGAAIASRAFERCKANGAQHSNPPHPQPPASLAESLLPLLASHACQALVSDDNSEHAALLLDLRAPPGAPGSPAASCRYKANRPEARCAVCVVCAVG